MPAILASIVVGCQSAPTAIDHPQPDQPDPAARSSDARPAAYLDGVAVSRDDLYQLMIEAQGGQVLTEIILDRAITRMLSEQGLTLTEADIQAERDQLLVSLSSNPDEATRLMNAMREQRGLGDRRFESLLRRNAGLRILVRDQITLGDAAIQLAYDLRYSPKYRVRLMTANNVDTLSKARQRVVAGESFTDLVIELSTDSSAAQGGLLSPISTVDATYPKAVRDALPKLSADDRELRVSPVIALAEGYALLWLEDVIHQDAPPIQQVRAELERQVRIELERVRMQQLARVLVGQANVVVLDPALDKAWQRQRETIVEP